jgi:hypothetical protein
LRRLLLSALAPLAACATLTGAAVPQRFMPGEVSTGASEWNLNFDGQDRWVFARSPEADFENAEIITSFRGPLGWYFGTVFEDAHTDTDPFLAKSDAGEWLLFASNRPGGGGATANLNLWRVRWSEGSVVGTPEPLTAVNSAGPELGPELHGGVLYFNSARRSGLGGLDIYSAQQNGDGFAAPQVLPAPLNSSASEGDFTLSRDGRTALFWSDRPGGLGEGDIYVSRRTGSGWSPPVNLGAPVNSAAFDFTPSLSADERWLVFSSMRKVDGADQKSDVYRIRVGAVPALKAALGR